MNGQPVGPVREAGVPGTGRSGIEVGAQPLIAHLLTGPPEHGVTRHGAALLATLRALEDIRGEHRPLRIRDGQGAAQRQVDLLHVTFTDRLFGSTPGAAVAAVQDFVATLAPRSWVLNLHDVPQPEEGSLRFARRCAAYARLMPTADAVIANSEHEAARLRDLAVDGQVKMRVIALPLEGSAHTRIGHNGRDGPATIGVLGFIYPGKGYERVFEVAPPGVRIRAIGAVADGHTDYVHELEDLARQRGVSLEVTGYVPEDALADELAAVDVPVCPHLHVSASGSLNTWISHGRVPLVVDQPYMREIARRWPGSLMVVAPEGLKRGIAECLRRPRLSWARGRPPQWGWNEVARAYSKTWTEVLR